MGHNTLGVIPGTKSWRVVVDLLDSTAATEDVIAASAKAAWTRFWGGEGSPACG